VYYNEILAYDTLHVDKGPVFRIPITIIKSEKLVKNSFTSEGIFRPGESKRFFFNPPAGSTFATLKFTLSNANETFSDGNSNIKFSVNTLQILLNNQKMSNSLTYTVKNQELEEKEGIVLKLVPKNLLEVNLSKFWAYSGTHQLKFEIRFRGIEVNNGSSGLTLRGQDGFSVVNFYSPLQKEEFTPVFTLNSVRRYLVPFERKLRALDSKRDNPIEGKNIYESIISYKLKVSKEDTFQLKPFVKGYLYESPFDSFLIMVFDENKKRLLFADVSDKSIKLEKGSFIIQVQLIYDNMEYLEKISKNLTLIVDNKLNPVQLRMYDDLVNMVNLYKQPLKKESLKFLNHRQEFSAVVDLNLNLEDYSSSILVGDVSLSNGKYSVPLFFEVASAGSEKPSEELPIDVSIQDKVKEVTLNALNGKSFKRAEKLEVVEDLLKQFPKDLTIQKKKLEILLTDLTTEDSISQVISLSNEMIANIPENDVMLFFSEKQPAHVASSKDYKLQK
jgi:CRISPR/Cas system-associated exonuclease Cas4 (RecB family)